MPKSSTHPRPHPHPLPPPSSPSASSPDSSPSPQTPPQSLSSLSPDSVKLLGNNQNNTHTLSLVQKDSDDQRSDSAARTSQSDKNDESADSNTNADNSDASSLPSGSNQVVLAMDTLSGTRQPNQPPGGNVGKGGCWTCRIRRKKCDEQRVGDSCQTCIRLRIDCLGWGPKRPPWMRDKQAVERYKAGIKEKLIKAGMVRGQPRLAHNNAASRSSSTSTNTNTSSTAFPGSQTQQSYQHPQAPSQSYGHPHGQQHRTQSSPAAFGGLGAMGAIGPVVALGMMGGDASAGGLASSSSLGYEFPPQRHSPHMHGQSHRYGPYPSPHLAAQQQLTPHASAVMDAEYPDPFFGLGPESVGQVHHEHRRASVGAAPVTHPHQRRLQTYPQQTANTNFGYQSGQAFGISNVTPQSVSPYEFPSLSFPTMGPMSTMSSSTSPSLDSLGVSGMNMPGSVHSSPLLIGDENSMLSYNNFLPSQAQHPNPPISRPPSGSTSSASTSSSVPGLGSSPQFSDPLSDPSLVDPHVQYYLKDVLPLQFPFASDNARAVMQNLFAQEPYGALMNASCALAAKHNKMVRVARMIDPPDADPGRSTAQQFFDRALWQINVVRGAGNGTPSLTTLTSNVLASLQLVGYFLLQGGTGAWQAHLDFALAWLGSTAICASENEKPGETLRMMNEIDLLAAKTTIWYDIFSAISLQTAPRFIGVYRRLFSGTISRVQETSSASMETLMGCPDDIMLALAETAELACWKTTCCRQGGTFNVHELIARGTQIHDRLVMSTIAESFPPVINTFQHEAGTDLSTGATSSQMHPPRPSGERAGPSPMITGIQLGRGEDANAIMNVAGASNSSGAPTPATLAQSLAPVSPQPSFTGLDQQQQQQQQQQQMTMFGLSMTTAEQRQAENRRLVSQVYLHTASLFLASVINESGPGVPEIMSSINATVAALQAIEGRNVDRILVFSFMLVGCLSVQLEHYQFVIKRLAALDPAFGNVHNTEHLVNQIWTYRNMQSVDAIDWYDMMRNVFGGAMLFV